MAEGATALGHEVAEGVTAAASREDALGAIIAAYNDVTDRLKEAYERLQHEVRRLREELESKNEALRRSERLAALGEMAAGLAHEVRNPLGGIALQASILERDLHDRPRAAATAEHIRKGVRSLDRIVTDVLAFAQEGTLDCAVLDVSDIVEQVIARVQAGAGLSGGRIVVDAAEDTLDVWGDRQRLERALFNLVQNGVQASGPEGRVTVTLRRQGDMAEIVVADDGPGIAEEIADRIFNPFFTTKADGTGLGLAIVHRIIEAHGGRISVRSAPGAGAAFTICLPRRLPHARRPAPAVPERAHAANGPWQ